MQKQLCGVGSIPLLPACLQRQRSVLSSRPWRHEDMLLLPQFQNPMLAASIASWQHQVWGLEVLSCHTCAHANPSCLRYVCRNISHPQGCSEWNFLPTMVFGCGWAFKAHLYSEREREKLWQGEKSWFCSGRCDWGNDGCCVKFLNYPDEMFKLVICFN